MKQEGYQIPTKLPLNKTEEKILKKIRRKIKNKVTKIKINLIFINIIFILDFSSRKSSKKERIC
jgi:hypothetical protein